MISVCLCIRYYRYEMDACSIYWHQHERSVAGPFAELVFARLCPFPGYTGDVVDTSTLSVIMPLPALQNTHQVVEIDWTNGVPGATSTHFGLGRVTG
ncbi:MAG TPA: hypothetical protein VFA09_11150 [Ktedonobacteraceae bacterium]|nr:hypothetical protein [Ktedonobacteraceae bacterium]